MKYGRFVVSLLTWLVLATRATSGCSCGPPAPMCQRYHEIKVMFVGVPVETNDGRDGFIKAGVWYRFKVEEAFKGLQPSTKEVVVDPSSGTSCQTGFEVGKRYLITSYGDSIADQHTAAISIIRGLVQGGKPRPSGPLVVVGGCSGSKPIERASEDIAFLRQYQRAPQNAMIIGSVRAGDNFFGWHDDHPPIADVKIGVAGLGRTIHTKTDLQGKVCGSGSRSGNLHGHGVEGGISVRKVCLSSRGP